MTFDAIDREKLRVALRCMSRGNLLIVAERAIEIVPRTKLRVLVGDLVRIEELAQKARGPASLLDEVRTFHDASLRGEHYESFNVNSKNYMDKSRGTERFIAEFDRLLGTCVRAAAKGPRVPVRDAFELLLALLRRTDEDSDSIVFVADEGGAWQVGVDWSAAFPYYERPKHMAAARRVANAAQKAALSRLSRARPGRSDSRRT